MKWIDLSNNKLTNASFLSSCSLSRLEEIYLSSNLLTHIPAHSFQATNTLSVFSVADNLLEALPRCALSPFYSRMQMFDISNNALRCDCELSWLQSPHIITTEKQSQCSNIKLTSTVDYDKSECLTLSECVAVSQCQVKETGRGGPKYQSVTNHYIKDFTLDSQSGSPNPHNVIHCAHFISFWWLILCILL